MKEQQLAKIAEEVGRRDLPDHILHFDRLQGLDNPDAQVCQYNVKHGRLGVHASGIKLVCTGRDGKTPCQFETYISR